MSTMSSFGSCFGEDRDEQFCVRASNVKKQMNGDKYACVASWF